VRADFALDTLGLRLRLYFVVSNALSLVYFKIDFLF
jgi:hypothetical protein